MDDAQNRPALPASADKRALLTQAGALCTRTGENGLELLLITSRDTGRWVIPKGWPVPGLGLAASAAVEAWEEAGLQGTPEPECVGVYSYVKHPDQPDQAERYCLVVLYRIHCLELSDIWPESAERKRAWFGLAEAAARVDEAELARTIASL